MGSDISHGMPGAPNVAGNPGCMESVELKSEVWRIYRGDDVAAQIEIVQEISRLCLVVDWLDRQALCRGMGCGPTQITFESGPCQGALCFTGHDMQMVCTQCAGVAKRALKILLEPLFQPQHRCEPLRATGVIGRRTVYQGHLQIMPCQFMHNILRIHVIGKQHLDRVKTGLFGCPEPFKKRQFGKKPCQVGAEFGHQTSSDHIRKGRLVSVG